METLERSPRALGVESAGRDLSRCKIVEKCARHRRLSDSALVSANQNDRRSCHLHPPVSRASHPPRNDGEFMAKYERRCEAMTFLRSPSASGGAVSAYAHRRSSRMQRYAT